MTVSPPDSHGGLTRPALSLGEAAELLATHYGQTGTLTELGSQQDRNFLVRLTSSEGETEGETESRYLLKISNAAFPRAEVEAQNAMMATLSAAGLDTPHPVPTTDGREIVAAEIGGIPHLVRLLTFVPGTPLIERRYLAPATIHELGNLAGRVSQSLTELRHPGLERTLQWDLRRGEEVVKNLLHRVRDTDRRDRITDAVAEVTHALDPLRDALPVQAVHGDLTDDNVVCTPRNSGRPRLSGVIDLGDAMLSWRVAELAVACTAVLHRDPGSPLLVLPLIAAFHQRVPLTEAEIRALWPLVLLRGAVLVVSGEEQVVIDPENEYAAEAIEREWSIFAAAATLPVPVAESAIRATLGLGPEAFGAGLPPRSHPLLTDIPAPVSLGTESEGLHAGRWLTPAETIPELVRGALTEHSAAVIPHGEAQLTRASALSREEPRGVPLFSELFTRTRLALHAPWAGTLTVTGPHSLRLDGDSLSLHLDGVRPAAGAGLLSAGEVCAHSDASTGLERGTRVWVSRTGAVPAGAAPVEFVRASEADAWHALYLDPAPLYGRSPVATAPTAELLRRRGNAYAQLQSHYYAEPPQIERGWREFLIDTDGRPYLDMVNNVTLLGHGHPRVAAAAADQWLRLNTNSRFHYAAVTELSEALLEKVPESLNTVLLVNSGSEAVDLALRLAAAYTDSPHVMCVRESYHGWSLASDAVSLSTSDNPLAASTRPSWVHAVDAPNAYRGTHRGTDSGGRYAADAVARLGELAIEGIRIGTFIAEPRNGNAGGIGIPSEYLPTVYSAIRAAGGVCISDEVQVGYGRLGAHFWGFEEHGVVPDIITVAKAMGNGHPLGAVITRRDIAEALSEQGSFFSSAGGSTLSARIGSTVLRVLDEEGLQENAQQVGGVLTDGLRALAERHPMIGALHGKGLYQGVELVRDRETLEPASVETPLICDRMRELGVIVQPTGDRQNVLKVKPPMCFTVESARYFVRCLDEVLTHGW
ncbi:aminotransferase [Klugiella xanthotipulae]|uniref:4-aminobutyrate aminotransferase-like enzyme n=1 Tax=Klugiella xanthotipulae TaxID=244735 RepID=A0A543HXR0_9MICO|nr:aminotransferase [Klugiella xanthotipulae]TQM63050.1 4-aminobutyrate aminotransferase-like enzyme [Klugiella xanthotipulae]